MKMFFQNKKTKTSIRYVFLTPFYQFSSFLIVFVLFSRIVIIKIVGLRWVLKIQAFKSDFFRCFFSWHYCVVKWKEKQGGIRTEKGKSIGSSVCTENRMETNHEFGSRSIKLDANADILWCSFTKWWFVLFSHRFIINQIFLTVALKSKIFFLPVYKIFQKKNFPFI